ncbi:thioesterase [Micromonospora qiuiae]|uniref:Thioesterase n=2 Tax=Micromonospora qiuiae TaxID=502268 RepID=A0ABQ4J988_9ACTN|nr:thioesterase [Micromonospora qiuiae]
MRLFCLPHAGGTAAAYGSWHGEFPEEIEVCAVELPGRRARLREPLIRRVKPLVAAIASGLKPHLDLPYAFFGHSYGALLAFELHHHLLGEGHGSGPRALFLSGASAPHMPRANPPLSHLDDEAFVQELLGYGGIPDTLVGESAVMQMFVPVLRADIEAFEHYVPSPRDLIDCPVYLYGGDRDHLAAPAQVAAWRELVAGPAPLELFPGGHFYLQEHRALLTASIARRLGRCLHPRPMVATG